MEKDETIAAEGTITDEEEDLLDFDLDDLSSEDGLEFDDDEDIIELVDLVTEDESEEFEDAGQEIKMLLDDDEDSGGLSGDVEEGLESDDLDRMLDDIDLDETMVDIDMSDVALGLDSGIGRETDFASVHGETGVQEESFEPAETELVDSQGHISELDMDGEGFSAEDFEKMLDEDTGGAHEVSDTYVEAVPPPAVDITEEALERMLEDETFDDVILEASPPANEPELAVHDAAALHSEPLHTPESATIWAEKVEEVVRLTILEALGSSVPQALTDAAERTIRDALTNTAENLIRETLPEVAGTVIRESLSEVAGTVIREALAGTEQTIRETLTAATENLIRETLPEVAGTVIREVLSETAERVVRETLNDTVERVVRESVTSAAEGVIRETIDALKAGLDATADRTEQANG